MFIVESYGREYWGAFNKHANIPNYEGYTPFLDSLAQESLIFTNAYSNGSKSIHGMSSVLSGIPSFKDAFTSSPYSKQKIQSLVSALQDWGYDTSFFHGAPNGSMGFLGFSNILGFDHYYGMEEYGNDADFDGSWGIWTNRFQFMRKHSTKETPFSVPSSQFHHTNPMSFRRIRRKISKAMPYASSCGYTDYAFKNF